MVRSDAAARHRPALTVSVTGRRDGGTGRVARLRCRARSGPGTRRPGGIVDQHVGRDRPLPAPPGRPAPRPAGSRRRRPAGGSSNPRDAVLEQFSVVRVNDHLDRRYIATFRPARTMFRRSAEMPAKGLYCFGIPSPLRVPRPAASRTPHRIGTVHATGHGYDLWCGKSMHIKWPFLHCSTCVMTRFG